MIPIRQKKRAGGMRVGTEVARGEARFAKGMIKRGTKGETVFSHFGIIRTAPRMILQQKTKLTDP